MDPVKLAALIKRYEEVYLFASREISSMISVEAQRDGITPEQYYAIRYLQQHSPCPSSDLAESCGVNRSAITAMVDRLVGKGFVLRARNEGDRRVVFLEITEEGSRVYREVEAKIARLVESYLKELDEEEVEAFIRIYEKIGAIIRKNSGGE